MRVLLQNNLEKMIVLKVPVPLILHILPLGERPEAFSPVRQYKHLAIVFLFLAPTH